MDTIFSAYDFAKANVIHGDFVDQVHSKYTVIFLLTTSLLIGFRQYEGKAFICWLPNQFSPDQVEYTHQLCWINGTYWYPSQTDADLFPESLKNVIPYYQFIIFILLAQSIFFYLPALIWQYLVSDHISYIRKLLDQVEKSKLSTVIASRINSNVKNSANYKFDSSYLVVPKKSPENDILTKSLINNKYTEKLKREVITFLNTETPNSYQSNIIDEENVLNRNVDIKNMGETFINQIMVIEAKRISSLMKPKNRFKHFARSYILLKVLNVLNVIFQFFFLRLVFGVEFYKYGFEFIDKQIINKKNDAAASQFFPILSFCDFYIHQNLRQVHTNTIQCLLPINCVNEQIFFIIWFWLVILVFVTFYNLATWMYEYLMPGRINFFYKYISIRINIQNFNDIDANDFTRGIYNMKSKNIPVPNEKKSKEIFYLTKVNLRKFQKNYLGNDGFIMLHVIKSISGTLVFMELLYEIWSDFVRSIEI